MAIVVQVGRGSGNRDSWFVASARWIQNRAWLISGGLSGIIAGFAANAAFDDWKRWAWAPWVVAVVTGGYSVIALAMADKKVDSANEATAEAEASQETAERERDEKIRELQKCLKFAAVGLYRQLRLSHTERVSVFVWDGGDNLLLVARYSESTTLRETGRGMYSVDAGFIGVAWNEMDVLRTGLPDPEADPDDYAAAHVAEGLSREMVDKLTMRSRCYAGCSLWDTEGVSAIGVLMLESTDPDRFDASTLEDGKHYLSLGLLTMAQKPDLPAGPDAARKEGF